MCSTKSRTTVTELTTHQIYHWLCDSVLNRASLRSKQRPTRGASLWLQLLEGRDTPSTLYDGVSGTGPDGNNGATPSYSEVPAAVGETGVAGGEFATEAPAQNPPPLDDPPRTPGPLTSTNIGNTTIALFPNNTVIKIPNVRAGAFDVDVSIIGDQSGNVNVYFQGPGGIGGSVASGNVPIAGAVVNIIDALVSLSAPVSPAPKP